MDLQDITGYVTNLNAGTVVLNDNYTIYEIDYGNRLEDGGYGGPCTSGPCPVDATALTNILFSVNAASGVTLENQYGVDFHWRPVGSTRASRSTI